MTSLDPTRFGVTTQNEPLVIPSEENKNSEPVKEKEVPMVLPGNGTTVHIKNLVLPKPDEVKERIDAIANIISQLTAFLSHLTGFVITMKSFEEKLPVAQVNETIQHIMTALNQVKPQLPIEGINTALTNAHSAFLVASNFADTIKSFLPKA